MDEATRTFLELKRVAVAGVSRSGRSPANAIAKKLRETGHEVFAINPSGETIDGEPSHPTVDAIEGGVEGVVVVTNPAQAKVIAEQAGRAGATWIWFHQGMGPVSFDDEALAAAREAGLQVIAAGCPMMYCEPDVFHRCARGLFRLVRRIPAEIEATAST
ncbi:MAG: CoA-binding protein [Myxococcales bacterium]|nr:CoA-binding protein [Myxococcales bacterium]MCB9716259.1 CoA-binding protein [Myxococcales bacterium]